MISRATPGARALPAWAVSGRAAGVPAARRLLQLGPVAAALGALTLTRPAAAQSPAGAAPAPAEPAAAPAPPAADAAPAPRVLVVRVEPGASGLEPAAVRAAIARELGVEVVEAPVDGALGVLTVRFDAADGLEMAFEKRDTGRSVERSLRVPPDPARRLEAVALLAGNLARDEAGDLVAALYAAEEARRVAAERDAAAKAAAEQAAAERARQARAAAAAPVVLGAEEPATAPASGGRVERITGEVERAIDAALAADLPELELDPVQAGVAPGIAIYPEATGRRFHAVFTLFYGRQGGVDGMAAAAIAQTTLGVTRGATGAGIWQGTGPVVGAAGAGIGQLGRGPLRGVEAAGILNLRSGVVEGAEVAGILNRSTGLVGAEVAAAVNLADGDLVGMQVAGLVNVVEGELVGAQAAGLVNVAREPATGVMAAGLVNLARAPAAAPPEGGAAAPRVQAWRFAGLANVGTTALDGALIAGLGNVAGELDGAAIAGLGSRVGDLDGAEIGGVASVARDLEGLQLATVNVARDVDGAQIGVVNVARRVRGAQIGLVNVSREIRGAPVGLVNITRGGPRLVVWHEHAVARDPQNLVGGLDLAVKTHIGPLYTQVGFGGDAVARTWDATGGLGLHLEVEPVFFEVDALYRGDWDARASNENDAQAVHYRGKVGVEVVDDALAVFAGGGLRQEFDRELVPSYSATALLGVEVY